MKKIIIISLLFSNLILSSQVAADEGTQIESIPSDVPSVIVENDDEDKDKNEEEVIQPKLDNEIANETLINDNKKKELTVAENNDNLKVIESPASNTNENIEKINRVEVTDLVTKPVLINETDRIIEVKNGLVTLETPTGIVEKKISDIGGKQLNNGKHEVIDKNGKKLILPKMNEGNTSVITLLGILLVAPIFIKIKEKFHKS